MKVLKTFLVFICSLIIFSAFEKAILNLSDGLNSTDYICISLWFVAGSIISAAFYIGECINQKK